MYIVVGIAVLFISVAFFKRAAGTLNPLKLNMISWIAYYNIFLQCFFSALLVVYSVDDHYQISKISNPASRVMGYWAIMYTMILFPTGMLLASKLFGVKPKILLARYTSSPIVPLSSKRDSYLRFPLYLISVLCVGAVAYTYVMMREIPILQLLSGGDALLLAGLREEVGREFAGNTILRNVFGILLTPIISYIAYCYYRMTNSRKDCIWFWVMFVLSVLILTYNIAKAPVILYFLGFLFLRIYEKGQIKKWVLVGSGLGALCILLVMYSFLSPSDSEILFGLNFGIPGRILLSQSTGIYYSFDTFPVYHDFLGFSSFSQLTSVLGIEPSERSARVIMERFHPGAVDAGTAGVANSLFIAEAWSNFGWAGLLVSPIYVGFLVQTMYVFFLKMKKTPLFLGLFVYFSYKGGISGGFNEYLYHPIMVILSFLLLLILFLSKYLKILKYNVQKNHISSSV
ncbi:oligosaccharide repeat unit polymerase [Parapedobacter sp.]